MNVKQKYAKQQILRLLRESEMTDFQADDLIFEWKMSAITEKTKLSRNEMKMHGARTMPCM